MLDLAPLAASAVTLLVPYLKEAAEKGIGTLAESAAGSLYGLLKKKLASPAAQEALADAEQAPASADAQTVLRVQIEKALRNDEQLVALLSQVLAQLQAAAPSQQANVAGDGNQVVMIQGSGNLVSRS
jgi:hypothetical protein